VAEIQQLQEQRSSLEVVEEALTTYPSNTDLLYEFTQ
jgi:hypothetical protein